MYNIDIDEGYGTLNLYYVIFMTVKKKKNHRL